MLRTRLIAGSAAGFVLSAVFATVSAGIGIGDALVEPLRVVPGQPAPITLRLPPITVRDADPVSGVVVLRNIQPVVPRGSIISNRRAGFRDTYTENLVRLYESSRRPPPIGAVIGLWFVYFLIAMLITSYLRTFIPSRGALLRTQAGMLGLGLILLAVAKVVLLMTAASPYVLPVAAVPLWASLYLDRRTSFMVTMTFAFLAASLIGFSLTAVTVFMAAGMAGAFGFRDRKHSTSLLVAGVVSGIASAAVLIAAKMLFEGGINVVEDLKRFTESELLSAATGGVLSGAFAFTLQPLAVLVLGAVSRSRLLDLTDLEQPLLQKMAREAPGSWEHSRAMANLAEAAAAAVGADSLLTRVGAYYHDLGKTCQPKYFVENLEPGETSPHADLEPDVSADAIMAHVVEGVSILRKGGIPEPVVEFAYTHHGTSIIEYFWHKCLEQGNPKNLKETFFRYPGMRPRNKETAILMLIDSIEAASRTVFPPERAKFEEMVQRILFVKLKQGQLDESGLTLEDLRVLSTRVTETLLNVYHGRVRYPWQDRQARGEAQLPVPGLATEKDMERDQAENERTGRQTVSPPVPPKDDHHH